MGINTGWHPDYYYSRGMVYDSGSFAWIAMAQPVIKTDTLTVSGSMTVSGTVTANLSATDNAVLDDIAANQTDASQKTQVVDGSGNVVGSTGNALDINIKSGSSAGEQYADGTVVNAAYKGTIVAGTDGSNYQFLSTDASGHVQVDVLSGGGGGEQYTDGNIESLERIRKEGVLLYSPARRKGGLKWQTEH